MTFSRRHLMQYALLIILTAVLTACASQSPETIESIEIVTVSSPVETDAATNTPESSDPVVTVDKVSTSPPGTPLPAEIPVSMLFNGIPHGLTEDGYPYLGDPDAGITLIDYSDFL